MTNFDWKETSQNLDFLLKESNLVTLNRINPNDSFSGLQNLDITSSNNNNNNLIKEHSHNISHQRNPSRNSNEKEK